MDKTYLVTGGCGFIGSHLVEFLLKAGNSVVVIDDLSSGSKNNLETENAKLNIIVSRVEDFDLLSLGLIDGVFHLAAQASVPYSVDHFFESSSTNLLSTLRAVEYCSNRNIPLVYASSSAIYGNIPVGNELGGIDLLSPYATDKRVSEIYCEVANKLYGLRSYGLRFFNVYGPRQDPKNPYSGVISIFLDRLLSNRSLNINGGHQTRDFIYVGDVVMGIWRAFSYLQKYSTSTYSNVLTGRSISIDDLADLLFELLNMSVDRVYHDLPEGDPVSSLGSTDLMSTNLSLSDFVPLSAGLKYTLDWMLEANESR